MLASASWDHTVRLWPLAGGAPRVLEGHAQNVNGVAFTPDGKALVSAGYDATLRIWPLDGGGADHRDAADAAQRGGGRARRRDRRRRRRRQGVFPVARAASCAARSRPRQTPIIALAISPDGTLVAAAGIRGSVAIIDRATRKLARTLVGPGLPVWSVAFLPDNRTLLTGGTDRMIRRWDAVTGEPIGAVAMGAPDDPLAAYAGDPRRAGVPRLRRLPHAHARRRQPRRPDLARHFRPPDRDAAGLQFLRRR